MLPPWVRRTLGGTGAGPQDETTGGGTMGAPGPVATLAWVLPPGGLAGAGAGGAGAGGGGAGFGSAKVS